MKQSIRVFLVLLATVLMSSSVVASIRFIDDFESYSLPDNNALGNDWLFFLNAYPNFPACDGYLFGFGPVPAPNSAGPAYAISNIAVGATGQALNVFSDYNSDQHPLGNCVETNVFQERVLTTSDAGQYTFRFEVQESEVLGTDVQTFGFIKLLNPNPPFETFKFIKIPTEAGGVKFGSISLTEQDAGLKVQWGFANIASNYLPSSRWYDNVSFAIKGSGSYEGDAIGVPVPFWAYIAIIGLLMLVGMAALRARKNIG